MQFPLKDRKFLLLVGASVLVLLLEVLSLLNIRIPLPYAPFIYAAFVLGIGYEILWNGLKALVKLKFSSISLLMLIAVIGAFYLGEYPEAAVVMVLYVLGERLEDVGMDNSKSALEQLVDHAPKMAYLKEGAQAVPVDKVPVGTRIYVKPGMMIPIDGKIISGTSTVDEAAITGEPMAKTKGIGDAVFAGTMNKEGFLEVQTTRISADTTFSKIVKLTFEANLNKSNSQKFIEKFARIYTPIIIVLALLLFVVPVFVLHLDMHKWLQSAISLLVISCPCALVISTPVATYAAIGNASAKGILVKGGKYMEAMASIRAIAFDKTRTITYGQPLVSDVVTLNGTSREELLACTAGAEVFSEHPVARAIVLASRKEGFVPHKAEQYKSIIGKGATAKCLICKNEIIHAGNLDFIGSSEKIREEETNIVRNLSQQGKTSVVVSFGKGVAGVIGLTDKVKPDSIEAVKEIRNLGIDTYMLTGDTDAAARFVAAEAGIEEVSAGLLPEGKSAKIKELLSRYQSVAMVGDGINDAPALAQCTVGIAMGAAGSDIAIETANIALMNDKLTNIPYLVKLAKATVRQIHRNIFGAVLVKLVFIILAFSGYTSLVLAILADVGVTLTVILCSLRLLKFRIK